MDAIEKQNEMIPNWSMFGSRKISIQLLEVEFEGKKLYNGAFSIYLDDSSKEDDIENGKFITIVTDVFVADAGECALVIANTMGSLFQDIGANVLVFDSSGSQIDELNLNELTAATKVQ